MPKSNTLEAQQAASWRALEPFLPEIIKRGVVSLLTEPKTAAELADTEAPALAEIISWQDIPNVDLLPQDSEAAQDEKLRRSFDAITSFKDYSLIPCPAAIASHADIAESWAGGWLRNRAPNYLERLGESLSTHGTDLASALGRNAKNIRAHNEGKNRPLRDFIKWDEALGAYEWGG